MVRYENGLDIAVARMYRGLGGERMSKRGKSRTWLVEVRSYTCCRGCEAPGGCAERDACEHGYDAAGRALMAPVEVAQHGADGIAEALIGPVVGDSAVDGV